MTGAARLQSTALSHVGKKRKINQDFHAIRAIDHPNGRYELLVLADGMGGGMKGEVASQTAVEAVVRYFQTTPWYNPEEACREAGFSANRAVWDKGTGGGEATKSFMGTTLVIALFETRTNRLWIVNVGDSRAYVLRGGVLEQLTRDHSLVAEHAHEGRPLSPEEVSRLKNVVTRAVGLESTVQPDIIGPLELGPLDRLLLSSDGLHGVVADARIAKLASGRLERAAKALVSAANAAGGPDNITVVLGDLGVGAADGNSVLPTRLLVTLGCAAGGIIVSAAGVAWAVRDRENGPVPTTPTSLPAEQSDARESSSGESKGSDTQSPSTGDPVEEPVIWEQDRLCSTEFADRSSGIAMNEATESVVQEWFYRKIVPGGEPGTCDVQAHGHVNVPTTEGIKSLVAVLRRARKEGN
ncbi:MAG: serine/threonine-protein phosphatase [Dehalococcoidia bacterium]|nr:serine/threonine-protein phosphatase [Dehalococcoidia bacterium]